MATKIIQVPKQVESEFLATIITLKVITNAGLMVLDDNELSTRYRLTAANNKDLERIANRLNTVITDIESDYVLYGC